MKKGLLGLVVAALTIVGCQNYDDQFDDLNKQIDLIQSSVNDLAGIQTAVGDLTTKLDQLANSALTDADLIDILDDVAEVKDAVDAIDVSGIEAEVTDLENEVDEILERLNELLSANAVIQGDIVIRNTGDLLVVEDLIGTEADDPLVTIQGNVLVSVASGDSLAGAPYLARVQAVMGKLKIVQGTVTVTTAAVTDMPELMYIAGDFDYVQNTGGSAATAKLRTINGTFSISGGGIFNYSQLANAAGVEITETSTITHIDFGGLTGAGQVVNSGTNSLVLDNATTVRVGGVLPTLVTLGSATSFESTYAGAAQGTSTINVGGSNATFSIASTGFTGNVSITSGGSINIPAVTSVKDLTITSSGTIDVSGITAFTGEAILDGTDVNVNGWVSNTATVTINTDTSVSAPALTTLTGNLVAPAATSISAPLLATTTGTIDGAAALQLTLKSIEGAASTHTTTVKDWATMTHLTLAEQSGITALEVSFAASLTTLDYTGAEVTSKGAGNQSNTLSLTSSNTKLVNLTLGGFLGSLTVSDTKLTTVNTTGANIVRTIFHNNGDLETFTFGHSHIQGDNACDVEIVGNAKVQTVDMSSLSKVQTVIVTGNSSLTSLLAPSSSVLATSLATITVTINGNKLSGDYTAAQAPTGTVSYSAPSISAAVLTSFKPWIEANVSVDLNAPFGTLDRTITAANASTGSTATGNNVDYDIDIDDADPDTAGSQSLSSIMNVDSAAENGSDGSAGTADDDCDTTGGVTTKRELDLVTSS